MLEKKIISNTTINFVGKGLSYLIQLAVIAYMVNKLGKEGYGIVVLAIGLVGNVNLFEAGFGLSVTKYVAEYNAKNDWVKINEVINTNILLILIQDILFVLLFLAFSHFLLNRLFNIPPNFQKLAVQLVDIFVLSAFIQFIWSGLFRIAEGFQWYSIVRSAEVIREILRGVFIVCFLYFNNTILSIGAAYVVAGLVSLVIFWYLVKSKEQRIHLEPHYIRWKTFKEMFTFSYKVFIGKLNAFISYKSDIFLIGFFLNTTSLTYYNIAYKIYEMCKYLFSIISSTIIPVSSELASLNSQEKLKHLLVKATQYSVIASYGVLAVVLAKTDVIIKIWMGSGFVDSVFLTRLFIISLLPIAVTVCGGEMLVGLDQLGPVLKYNISASIINIIISFILVQKIGTAGVIWGTVIGSFINAVFGLKYLLKYLELPLTKFLNKVFFKTALLALFVYGIVSWTPNLWVLTGGIIIYIVISLVFLVDVSDKKKLYNYFGQLRAKYQF